MGAYIDDDQSTTNVLGSTVVHGDLHPKSAENLRPIDPDDSVSSAGAGAGVPCQDEGAWSKDGDVSRKKWKGEKHTRYLLWLIGAASLRNLCRRCGRHLRVAEVTKAVSLVPSIGNGQIGC